VPVMRKTGVGSGGGDMVVEVVVMVLFKVGGVGYNR
jgi:hypothetical protein